MQVVIVVGGACWAAGTKGPGAKGPGAKGAPASARPGQTTPGREYAVGPGQTYARLGDVPWEALDPGDTVRIFWRPTPYNEKFVINRPGTAAKPIRIVGMPGPAGQRPTIDGKNATTRGKQTFRSTGQGPKVDMQNLALILLDGIDYSAPAPEYIVIEGLDLRGASSPNGFTGTAGDARTYSEGVACIRVQKGAHITIRNNEISDCDNGLFTQSQEDALTRDILVDGNYLHDCGIVSKDGEHDSYVQSVGAVYQYNHYGRQRPGAKGSALKDRSIGTVVRFNRFEGCARTLDLVEAENTPRTALKDPAYRETFVYGNIIEHDNNVGVAIHYGGDHYGGDYPIEGLSPPWTVDMPRWPPSAYGESYFRQGTLYFYSNTVIINGAGGYGTSIFQISTTLEHAQIFNNVLWMSGNPRYTGLLAPTRDLGKLWKNGGTVDLGVNLYNDGWLVNPDPGANHATQAIVTGKEKVLTTGSMPVDPSTFRLVKGSAGIDAAQSAAALPSVRSHPVDHEYTEDLRGRPRVQLGKAMDLGALESF
jgi:hypothetical protein